MYKPITLSKPSANAYTLLWSLVFVGGLYALQTQIMSTVVRHMANPGDASEHTVPADGGLGQMAVLSCNNFVRGRMGDFNTLDFPKNGYRTWEFAEGRYLVRSHFTKQNASGHRTHVAFACHVQFDGALGDDDLQGRWLLEGLEFSET